MKHTIAALAILAATPLTAGGLSDPIVTPPIVSSNPPSVDRFAGFYAGGFAGQSTIKRPYEHERIEITPTEREVPVYDTCKDDGGHSGGEKCRGNRKHIDLTFGPDLGGHNRYTQTGFISDDRVFLKGEPVTIVDDSGAVLGEGVADGTNPSGTLYRLDTGETQTIAGPDLVETFIDVLTGDTSDATYGAFAGYRFGVADGVYAGAEVSASNVMTTAEVTGAVAAGNMIITASGGWADMDGADGTTFGVAADYHVGQGFFGVKGYKATFDDADVTGVVARVGWSF